MQIPCVVCQVPFETSKPAQAKYCGETCKKRAQRAGTAGPSVAPKVDRAVSGLVDAVEAELTAADRLNSVLGQHAMELAGRIVSAPGMNAGVASLSKELSRVMSEALKLSSKKVNPLDELRARRDAKRVAG